MASVATGVLEPSYRHLDMVKRRSSADQPRNNRRIVTNVRAIGASKMNASRINVTLPSRRRRQRFMMGTSIRCKYTPEALRFYNSLAQLKDVHY